METFTALKAFEDDPYYHAKRDETLRKLQIRSIDAPLVELINAFAKLPYCFTLQSCYGHFIHKGQRNHKNTEPLSNCDKDSCIQEALYIEKVRTRYYAALKQLVHNARLKSGDSKDE